MHLACWPPLGLAPQQSTEQSQQRTSFVSWGDQSSGPSSLWWGSWLLEGLVSARERVAWARASLLPPTELL